jgi:hypothetical protein
MTMLPGAGASTRDYAMRILRCKQVKVPSPMGTIRYPNAVMRYNSGKKF